MVFLALVLLVLMIFAAFAVDLGTVYNERRIDQNSADAATTSGAIQFLKTQTLQGAVDEAVAKVDTNLGRAISQTTWEAVCDDPAPLTRTAEALGLMPATECISFSAGFDRLRVWLPDQVVATTFGRVVGINQFTSTAFAEVSLSPNGGGALPFVVLSQSGVGDQICLRTDGTGGGEPPDQPAIAPYQPSFQLDPCNKDSFITQSGARGTIKPWLYASCSQGSGNQTIVDAIIAGVDHPLGTFDPEIVHAPGASANAVDSTPAARIDGANSCAPFPNSVEVDTGLTAQLLICAILENPCNSGSSATNGRAGRLYSTSNQSQFADLNIDDQALWDFFVGSLPTSAPSSCTAAKSSATAFYTRRAALMDCLQNWTTGVLFTDDVGSAPRLGFVPQIAERCLYDDQAALPQNCSSPALKNAHINGFSPVYLDGVYVDKGGTCDTTNPATPSSDSQGWAIHYPGKDLDCAPGESKIHRISGVVVPCGSLPLTVCDPSPAGPFPDPLGITKVRLAK